MKFIFLLVIIINLFYSSFANSNEIYVVSKVNNQIITNTDVNKEYRYLVALNPNLKNIDKIKNDIGWEPKVSLEMGIGFLKDFLT